MSLAACLLLYSLVVAALGPELLTRSTRQGAAPRVGIAAWSVAALTVPASWVLAAGAVAAEFWRAQGATGQLFRTCLAVLGATLTGRYGTAVQLALLALAGLAVLAIAMLTARFGQTLLRARRQTHQHAASLRAVGRYEPAVRGAVVLDAAEPVAYCAAGRPATIVVTRGALTALTGAQLDAVLAHERAHLAGRHHLLVAVTRALATSMPRIRLFTAGAAEIARLVEMRADDAAAREHGGRTVAGALVALASGPTMPTGALGATAVGVVERVERLLVPSKPFTVSVARLRLAIAVAILLLGPTVGAALLAEGAALCNLAA